MINTKIMPCEYGLGVFATKNIAMGQQIEKAYMLQVEYMACGEGCMLEPYVFASDWLGIGLIGTGHASFYNHNSKPNADWEIESANDEWNRCIICITALCNIVKGAQIYINYGYDPVHD